MCGRTELSAGTWPCSGVGPGRIGRRRGRGRPPVLHAAALRLLHRFCKLLLVVVQQGFDFVMGLVAHGVDLRTESLARGVRILIEQRLNLVVVSLEQRPDLSLLCRGEFQIFYQVIEFLVDRPRAVDSL
jgi:hypothetical protein